MLKNWSSLPSTMTPRPLRRVFPGHGPARCALRPRPPTHQAQLLATSHCQATTRLFPASDPAGAVGCVCPLCPHHSRALSTPRASATVDRRLGSPVWPLPSLPCAGLPLITPQGGSCLLSSPLHYQPPGLELSFRRRGPPPPCAPVRPGSPSRPRDGQLLPL